MADFERQVIDALPVTIYTVDLDGCITSANASWSRFARDNGAPQLAVERDIVGQSIWAAMADQLSRDRIEQAMGALRAGRTAAVSWEFPCSSPTQERVFLMQITALRDDGAPTPAPAVDAASPAVSGYVFSTVDITLSHRSREALIDTGIALARTIALDRVFPEVALQVRRAVSCDAFYIAIVDDDTAALRVAHRYGDDDVDAAAVEADLTPVWLDALANGQLVRRDTARGLELTAPMASAEGALGAMTLVMRDGASAHRLSEIERVFATLAAQTAAAVERAWLVRRVEQKRRLEAIGEVATGIAHELRNPLFGISSAAQLLRFRVKDDPVVEKNVGRILKEVERLNRMVGSLLDYGRPRAVRLVPGDPDAVWDDVLEGGRGRLEAKALELHRSRANPPARCAIDVEQLAQVFLNVLVNAVDGAPEASDLTLHTGTLASGAWRCRLQNRGPAIPPEVLARVFEIFYSTKPGGTGIGLALCQRIVDEHRGTISLESTPERGTTLTIVLPPA